LKPGATNPRPVAALSLASLFASFSVLGPLAPFATASGAKFAITNASWGTGTTSLEVGPGSVNVPLVVTFQFLGSSTASRIQATLGVPGSLPSGITDTYGNPQPTASTVSVQPDTAFQLTYYLNIAQSVPVGTYLISVEMKWNYTSQSSPGYFDEIDSFNARILGTVQMSASTSQSTLNAGEVNNVTLTLTNRGAGTASQISPALSTSAGSVLTILPVIQSLTGGASVPLQARVYVPPSSAGAAVTLTLSTTYFDSYGLIGTSALPVGFYAVTAPEPTLSFTAAGESLSPGQANDVIITLTNSGPGTATSIKTTVNAPSGFSVLNQFPQVAVLQSGKSVNGTLRVFAPASAAGSAATLTFTVTFNDPYGYPQSATQALGLFTASEVAIVAATSLSVTTSSNSLTAGVKSPVAFIIRNTGQQPVFAPTISLTTSAPLIVSANSTLTFAGVMINPGNSLTYFAEVTTASGATGGFYAGSLTITFNDQFGNSHTQTVPVAFVVTLPISQVSVSSMVSQIGVGRQSTVAFMISNSGTAPVYSPTFSLTTPSGLAVTSNSTFSRSGLVINPGKSVKYVANITSGPKTAEGAYIATLTVSYADQFGNTHSSAFSVGVIAVGQIQMVVQNERISRNGTSISVTGTLVNEGLANAYYTEVTATLTAGTSQLATSSSYVGEVDSNTPLPVSLSLTIPATALASANGTGTLTLTANYQNDFGQALQFKNSQRVSLSSGPSNGGSTSVTTTAGSTVSAGTLNVIRYAALIGIVVAAVVTLAYVRRSRSKGKQSSSKKSDVY
jgi:uncharacterized membrane protein